MSNETKSILMATEVIALNQDPLGVGKLYNIISFHVTDMCWIISCVLTLCLVFPLYLLLAGDLVYQLGPHQVYAGPLADGSRGVILVNLHTTSTQYPAHNMTVQFRWIGYTDTTM